MSSYQSERYLYFGHRRSGPSSRRWGWPTCTSLCWTCWRQVEAPWRHWWGPWGRPRRQSRTRRSCSRSSRHESTWCKIAMNVLSNYAKVVAIACPKRVTDRFTERVIAKTFTERHRLSAILFKQSKFNKNVKESPILKSPSLKGSCRSKNILNIIT